MYEKEVVFFYLKEFEFVVQKVIKEDLFMDEFVMKIMLFKIVGQDGKVCGYVRVGVYKNI